MDDRVPPRWISHEVILAIHERQISEHGGGSGIRDNGLLESAMSRPVNRWNYGEDDLATLAAAYAFGIARNHPFADGNKRSAWVAARLFLALNDVKLAFDKADAVRVMLALAAGEMPEDMLAEWFREHLTQV